MNKAILTKAQADALENALDNCVRRENIITNHINGLWSGKREVLKGLSLESLIIAIYIGYEIECTKEEKLLSYINQLSDEADRGELIASSKIAGVMKALEIMEIDVEELKGVKFDVYA